MKKKHEYISIEPWMIQVFDDIIEILDAYDMSKSEVTGTIMFNDVNLSGLQLKQVPDVFVTHAERIHGNFIIDRRLINECIDNLL